MKTSIVLGLGYGNEGKGMVTSYLVSKNPNALVVRFNGGHQTGHTVNINGKSHVFSHLGSGALQEAETYWAKNCVVDLCGIINEMNSMYELGIRPKLTVHPYCSIITPYDISFSNKPETLKLGTFGISYSPVHRRNEEGFTLFAQDLMFPEIFKIKLQNIRKYYGYIDPSPLLESKFKDAVDNISDYISVKDEFYINPSRFSNIVFEGAEGLLMDKRIGIHPDVSRTPATTEAVIDIMRACPQLMPPDIYYVTRTYQTKYGQGIIVDKPVNLVNTESETNSFSSIRGEFKKSMLDIDMLKYSLLNNPEYGFKRNLVLTCIDQTTDNFGAILEGKEIATNTTDLVSKLPGKFDTIIRSTSPDAERGKETIRMSKILA
jgi:adenylosuccinate synthase